MKLVPFSRTRMVQLEPLSASPLQLQSTNAVLLHVGSSACIARNFGHDSVVCECNSTYCDSVGSVTLPRHGQYASFLSTMAGSRLEAGQGQVLVNGSARGER